MYRDSFSEPRWMGLLRWLSASFPLGRFFRVRVRVYWLALLIMPLIFLRQVEGLPFVQATTYIVLTTLALYVVIWSHEMGHITAGRRYGIETPLITLSPLGGLAHMNAGAPSPAKEIVISLAGPAVHLIWLAIVFPLSLFLTSGTFAPQDWLYDPLVETIKTLVYLNAALLVFNLLPLFPMDGGRCLRALFARRMHPNRATLKATRIGSIGGWLFIVGGIVGYVVSDNLWGPILVAIGISNLLACKQERLAAQYTAGPYMTSTPLQPWQSDPEAWKQGDDSEASPRDLRKAEKAAAKEAARRETTAAQERAQDGDVDRVLDRLNEVGLEGLTAKERGILERASKRRRGE